MILPENFAHQRLATPTIPAPYNATLDAAAHLASGFPGTGSKTQSWSSLIGIVTAIVGNILISFALNTQRYAHIRLEREAEEKSESSRRSRSQSRRGSFGAGALAREDTEERQSVAEAKRRQQSTAQKIANDGIYEDGAHESDPLLPRVNGGEASEDSDRTIHGDDDDEDEPPRGSYLKSPYWWAGIIMMTVGEAGNFLAYGFAPASIVSPLGVVALISNCIVGPLVFKEAFRKRDFLGVVIAVGGAVTVVLSAKTESKKLGPNEIWKAISTMEFEIYFGVTVGLIILLMLLSSRYGGKSILIDLGLVGLFGGYTALSTKGVASLLSYKLWRLITFPVTYLLAFILIFTAVMQIKYVNRALKRFEATQVIPTQFVMFTLSVILGSAILYRDFERTTAEDAGKFVGGCIMTFMGVWLITSARENRADEDDRDPEPADAIDLRDGERYQDGEDGEETPKVSRIQYRSTHSNSSIPETPPSSISRAPSVQVVTPSDTSLPPSTPGTTSTDPWSDIPTATTPTPHSPYTTNILSNSASISTPDLLTGTNPTTTSTPSIPRPPIPRAPSDLILSIPQTPAIAQPQRHLLERAQTTAQRSRHSVASPLLMTSPLSGSLSAVVAELRRGSSLRSAGTGSPLRQRRSAGLLDGEGGYGTSGGGNGGGNGGRLRLSRTVTGSGSGTRRDRERGWMGSFRGRSQEDVIDVSGIDGEGEAEEQESGSASARKTPRRGRSLSNTLGGMFKGWMSEDRDGEGGGSGNGNSSGNGSGNSS